MTLLPGTLLSQAIPVVFSIILARIYSPDLFGTYFLFTSILGLAIIFSTGKYELAILIPESDKEASRIIGVALTTCLVFSFLLLILCVLFNGIIVALFKTPHFGIWLVLLPFSLFFSAGNEIFYYWHNRRKRYPVLSWSKIIQAFSSSVLQLILGLMILGVTGLIAGLILGQAISFFFLLWKYLRKDSPDFRIRLFTGYRPVARKYLNFPRDIAVASFINEAANQLPNIFMTRYLGQTVVGHYGYAQRTVRTPIGVLSNAFSDVYKSRASEEFITEGNVRRIFLRTMKTLFLVAIGPFTALFLLAPILFSWLFGEAYATSGIYARVFSIPLFFSFVISPLTSTFYIINKTTRYLFVQVASLVLVILALIGAYLLSKDPLVMVIFLAGAITLTNLLALGMLIFYVNRVHNNPVKPLNKPG
ncbi:MAG: oligosaccharide flippase family protein [Bacteroidetes bacterium]|nr:oligosaccharide flippase family protein [Bacteroidota bacterium]